MGLSNLSIQKRIVAMAFVAATAAMMLPANIFAQEKLQKSGGGVLGVGNEPVVTVTIGSINKLMEDVNYITGVAGQPQAGGLFTMMAGTFTQGLDTTQPIGILVPMVDGVPEPIAVIPTTNVKAVLKRLEAQTGPVDELDDGTLVIAVGANTVYIRQVGDWAAAARTREILNLAPINPVNLFEGMGNNYDFAARVQVQQIPEDTRGMLVAQMRQGFEQAMAQQNNGDEEATRKMAESTFAQLDTLINEADEINVGFNINQVEKRLEFDFSFTAVPGTKLASVYSGALPIPSKFSKVINQDAAAYFHLATSVSPDSVEMTRDSMDGSLGTLRATIANQGNLPQEQKDKLNKMIDRISKLFLDSVAEGKMDMGAMLMADTDMFQFAMGSSVADGNEAAQLVKDLAAEVKDAGDAPRFKFDQGTYNGVTMHVIEADVPASEDEARQIFGEMLEIHIGTGPKAVYMTAGKDSGDLIKTFIDSGANDAAVGQRPLSQLRFVLLPVLRFAQSIDDNPEVASMIDSLSGEGDQGEIRVISEPLQNGGKSQITVGEGLIKAIGAAAAQAQQRARGGQF